MADCTDLCSAQQADHTDACGRQLATGHALKVGAHAHFAQVLEAFHLVHLGADQHGHGLQHAGCKHTQHDPIHEEQEKVAAPGAKTCKMSPHNCCYVGWGGSDSIRARLKVFLGPLKRWSYTPTVASSPSLVSSVPLFTSHLQHLH